jgi:hypothetical protein
MRDGITTDKSNLFHELLYLVIIFTLISILSIKEMTKILTVNKLKHKLIAIIVLDFLFDSFLKSLLRIFLGFKLRIIVKIKPIIDKPLQQ